MLATFAVPGYTDGSTVTRGEFAAFATAAPGGPNASTYGEVAGHTQMIGAAEGKTIVSTHVTGLLPNTTYGSHVHAAPCDVGDADGHYKDDPSGPATPPNELWPGFTTDDDGVGNGKDKASWTAGTTAVSVVVHAPDGAKIACADLA
jgi:hypothetical protein